MLLIESKYLDSHYCAGKTIFDKMLNSVGFNVSSTLLDAGSGNGCYSTAISKIVGDKGKVVSIDINSDNLFSFKRTNEISTGFSIQANLISIPMKENTVDGVWCSNVFQYLTENEKIQVLNEFKRIVKPGGKIAIKEVDLSTTMLGPSPRIFWHIVLKAMSSRQINSSLNMFNVLKYSRMLNIQRISYKTYILEWTSPIESKVFRYLHNLSGTIKEIFRQIPLSEEETFYLENYIQVRENSDYVVSEDFYWREGYILILLQNE